MLGLIKKKVGRSRKVYLGPFKLFEYQKPRGEKEKKDLILQQKLEKSFRGRADSPLISNTEGVVVSLTSFGNRVGRVHVVLESILRQSRIPQKLILWLDQNEFTEHTLPRSLVKAKALGVEIGFCENTRSYKKIIPTLSRYPGEVIVTIDDDVMYPRDFLEILLQYHQAHPNLVLCYRAHRISFNEEGEVLPYSDWESRIHNIAPGKSIFPTGSGGVLYPPGCFASEVTEARIFMDICPSADDIWLKAMTLKQGVSCWVVPCDSHWSDVPPYVDGTQEACLAEENVDEKNDIQLKAVFDRYKLWASLDKE